MFQRPKIGETEEDLLKQEEEFLKSSGKESAIKRKHEEKEVKAPKRFEIIGDIREKVYDATKPIEFKIQEGKGFPSVFEIDNTIGSGKKKKKSLFALQLEKNKNNAMEVDEAVVEPEPVVDVNPPPDKDAIHKENVEKLSNLSEAEILEEQKKLLKILDPKLVSFLKNRGKVKANTTKTEIKTDESEEEVKKTLEKYVDSKWINMDFIEKEKLEWIGEIPDKKSLEPDQPYSARFDFKGKLQPFNAEIDVRNSLYHHGDEPDRPGYTIQELYQLSRSQVLQQRNVALTTLANIIRNTKLGYYDRCFDGQLLHKLVESDLFFLLRFSIDENSLVPASVYCLHNLMCNESDEFCLDKSLGILNVDTQPLLFVKIEANKDEENELKDHVVIGCDLIKGVLRTDLLIRFCYVLENFSPTRETVIRIVNCLIRISRHSLEAATAILKTKSLLRLLYNYTNTNAPIYEGVKLFRLLISHSKEIAVEIIQNYDFRFLVSFIEAEENLNISKKEFYLLKLESLYLWRGLLLYDIFIDEFILWSPCLIRLLLFYTQKVDVNKDNDFDFELFSAMTSLTIVCNLKKIPPDHNTPVMMRICLEKWLTQLIQLNQYNFAICKALGCCFRYFTTYFQSFGVEVLDLEFIKKINVLLVSLFQSEIFNEMSNALCRFSYLLSPTKVTRDPENLPSLCSVYDGGDEFLSIVQNNSPIPFFISLAKYLKTVNGVARESERVIRLFIKSSSIQKYISKINKCTDVSYNWFMEYEIEFLTDFIEISLLFNKESALRLGFSLLPLMRVDDENAKLVMKILCDKNNWELSDNFLNFLGELFSDLILQNKTQSVLYKNDLVPLDWPYKALSFLRGKEAVEAVKNVLKFISLILDKNPDFIKNIPYTYRFYNLCHVFLTDSNVFDVEIQNTLEKLFENVLENQDKVNLNLKFDKKKSFYDLYTELITQYAGVSYGLPVFAKLVMFPLQNRFNVSFRKLIWFEYMHVLRVVTLSYPVGENFGIKGFVEPCEVDESLLVAYLNSVTNNVILKRRNAFVYNVAIGNVSNFVNGSGRDEKLLNFLKRKINELKNEELKNDILNFKI